jgi:hypothetical protein
MAVQSGLRDCNTSDYSGLCITASNFCLKPELQIEIKRNLKGQYCKVDLYSNQIQVEFSLENLYLNHSPVTPIEGNGKQ